MKLEEPSNPPSDQESAQIERLKGLILTDEQLAEHPFYNEGNENQFYVISLNKGEKTLLFFGSPHINHPDDPDEKRVFEEIKKRFEETRPEIVFVEGMEGLSEHRDRAIAESKKESLEDAAKQSESHFALKLAIDAEMDFESPEPTFSSEMNYLLEKGFSQKDIFLQQFYLHAHQYQRSHQVMDPDECKKYMQPFIKRFYQEEHWDKSDLELWEKETFDNLNLEDEDFYIKQVDPVPWSDREQTVYNEISRISGEQRSPHIFEKIAEALGRYNRVFVVYGSAHALRQEPAFRALFEKGFNE